VSGKTSDRRITLLSDTLLALALIFIVIAVVLMVLGFLGRVAWKIAKWLIIIFIILAIISYFFP
jgi:uncharacterized membrane protein YtjA (UPF0391 family)